MIRSVVTAVAAVVIAVSGLATGTLLHDHGYDALGLVCDGVNLVLFCLTAGLLFRELRRRPSSRRTARSARRAPQSS